MSNHVSRIPLTDQVYQRIMQSIFEQQYAPGQELRINQIAHELGVSATPVREALSRLVTARMVELTSFKGFRVAGDMGAEDIRHLFAVRIMLEIQAVSAHVVPTPEQIAGLAGTISEMQHLNADLSTDRIDAFGLLDRRFHRSLVDMSGNPFLISAYESLDAHIHIGRLYLKNRGVIAAEAIIDEHSQILDLYQQSVPAQVAEVMRRHLVSAMDRILAFLAARQPAPKGA